MSVIVAEMKEEGFWRVLCPREEKKIPVYHCVGSLVKQIETCDSLRSSVVSRDGASVKCLWPEERRDP